MPLKEEFNITHDFSSNKRHGLPPKATEEHQEAEMRAGTGLGQSLYWDFQGKTR